MADLGTLTTKKGGDRVAPAYTVAGWLSGAAPAITLDYWKHRTGARRIASWAISPGTRDNGSDIDVSGTITGSVKEGATAIPYCWVHLYYRPTGERISSTKTDASGNFTFTGLQASQSLYFAVALDPDGGTTYNALVYDRVSPS